MIKLVIFAVIIGAAFCAFPDGKFKYGIAFGGGISDDTYKKYDYISMWINSPWSDNPKKTDFNPWWHGEMVKKCLQLGKMPLFYGYVIAFQARADIGLQDCDVDPNYNLCNKGANYIRQNRAKLVQRYSHQATEIAKALGDKNKEVIFVMEPDFWQFFAPSGSHGKKQEGGPLDGPYMRALFDDFCKAIKAQLPNAKISWDISAWIGEEWMNKWWGFFKTSPYISFVHTSGGQAHGESSQIKPNELAWAKVSQITGKKIIADCGYGVGGAAAGNCGVWNDNNRQARVKDGVIALSAGDGAKSVPPASLNRQQL